MSDSRVDTERRPDRRVEKSVEALKQAFLSLLFERRYHDIKMAEIADRANVARSTLYQHFRSKEEMLEVTMAFLLAILADAATGQGDAERVDAVLAHFWEKRRLAKAVFGPPVDALVRRSLATMIESRLRENGKEPSHAAIAATHVAGGHIALLEAWLTGKLVATQADIAAKFNQGVSGCL